MSMKLITTFLPEIALTAMTLIQILINVYQINKKENNFPIISEQAIYQTFLILVITLILQISNENITQQSLLCMDVGCQTIKVVLLFFSLPLTLIIGRAFVIQNACFVEFFSIFLFSIVGSLLLISASDFLVAYLALEMQALSFYVLACFNRTSSFSTDAGLKYFILGSFVSGIFLMGCLFIYGTLGTLNLSQITVLLSIPLKTYSWELNEVLSSGVLLVTISLLFKLAVVPFHFWAPDVYEGAPTYSTIAISILPKIATMYFFLKVLNMIGPHCSFILDFLIGCGCASIVVGACLAILQNRAKRFFVYSSIAQTGFFVIALGIGTYTSFHSLFVFLIIYTGSTILIWGFFVDILANQKRLSQFKLKTSKPVYLSTISNYFLKNKIASLILIGVLFSIGGMPPSGGFLAKIRVLECLVDSEFLGIAIFVIFVSSLSFFYYLRFVKIIFFEVEQVRENKEMLNSGFKDSFDDLFCCLAIFGCLCLYFVLFNPELLILISDLIVLGTKGY